MPRRAHYSIVKLIPDPVRGESLNIGVIMVGDNRVYSRFLRSFKRAKRLYPTIDEERISRMRDTWDDWFGKLRTEPGELGQSRVLREASDYLTHQTQLSDPRAIELGADAGGFEYEAIVDNLFERLVQAPTYPRRQPKSRRTQVKTMLRREFRQLDLLHAIQENSWVEGTISHPVTVTYQNGKEVAMDAVELQFANSKKQRANMVDATYGKWVDVNRVRPNEVEPISVLRHSRAKDFDRWLEQLASVSTVYVLPGQIEDVREKILADLLHQKDLEA